MKHYDYSKKLDLTRLRNSDAVEPVEPNLNTINSVYWCVRNGKRPNYLIRQRCYSMLKYIVDWNQTTVYLKEFQKLIYIFGDEDDRARILHPGTKIQEPRAVR